MNEHQLPTRVTDEQVIEQPQTKLALDKQFVSRFKPTAEPSVLNLERFKGSGTVLNVTYFNSGQDGQRVVILGDGTTTIVHDPLRIKTNTAANKLLAADMVYRFTRYDGVWVEDEGGGGGGGGAAAMEFYTTGVLIDQVVVNPRPTADTAFPGLSLVIPGSAVARTFMINGYVYTTTDTSTVNNCRISLQRGATKVFTGGNGGGTLNMTWFILARTNENGGTAFMLPGVPVVIPGDSAAHTIALKYNAVGTTATITFVDRFLSALQVA